MRKPIIPSGRDAVLAQEASRAIDESTVAKTLPKICLVKPGEEAAALELPPAATALLKELLKELAAGRAVTVVPIDAEITTQQAAEILNVSRPFVAGLIDKGKLPGRMVGAHRRVRPEDVLAYKRDSKAKARAALHEMIAISQDLWPRMSASAAPIAILDASVFYSASLRHLLISLAVAEAFQARWTDLIQDEWTRSLLRDRPDLDAGRIARTRQLMDAHVDDAIVTGHEPFIASLTLSDPDDRHVLAAAIHCCAATIVTLNLKRFPARKLAPHGVEALHPDAFACLHFAANPEAVIEGARWRRAELRNPPRSPEEYLAALESSGLVATAAALRHQLGDL